MTDQHEATLEELLEDPIVLKLMARDGVRGDDIRWLLRRARPRTLPAATPDLRALARKAEATRARM